MKLSMTPLTLYSSGRISFYLKYKETKSTHRDGMEIAPPINLTHIFVFKIGKVKLLNKNKCNRKTATYI